MFGLDRLSSPIFTIVGLNLMLGLHMISVNSGVGRFNCICLLLMYSTVTCVIDSSFSHPSQITWYIHHYFTFTFYKHLYINNSIQNNYLNFEESLLFKLLLFWKIVIFLTDQIALFMLCTLILILLSLFHYFEVLLLFVFQIKNLSTLSSSLLY